MPRHRKTPKITVIKNMSKVKQGFATLKKLSEIRRKTMAVINTVQKVKRVFSHVKQVKKIAGLVGTVARRATRK